MDEANFWSALEYRVCREMAGIERCARLGMWCDGFIVHAVDLSASPKRIFGRAWIGLGSHQEPWTFKLLLPDATARPDEIPWSELLPAADVTRWLTINREGKHLVVAPLRKTTGGAPVVYLQLPPCQEDWGWEVLLSANGKRIFIGIGQYEIDDQVGWMCFVESDGPFYKRCFGVRSDAERQLICVALHDALQANPQITQIRWHRGEDFMKGNESNWTERPKAEPSV